VEVVVEPHRRLQVVQERQAGQVVEAAILPRQAEQESTAKDMPEVQAEVAVQITAVVVVVVLAA
jgi:hypothetical protein